MRWEQLHTIESVEASFLDAFPHPIHWPHETHFIRFPQLKVSSSSMLQAFHKGIFPWNNAGEPREWWSPNPRAVLFLDELHISRSTKKILRRDQFQIRADVDFNGVLVGCANRPATWLDSELVHALQDLHHGGYSHSFESWKDDQLVGGVFGTAIGDIFIGDSMFSAVPNASKVALVHLVRHLRQCGFRLIDCQVLNPHTESLGAREISRFQYLKYLDRATRIHPSLWRPL